jgi:predicted GIY-YIG superfamily endonuclease
MTHVHYVYVLYSGNRTYCGYTVNPSRRLRQHNGELVGGAKSTRALNNWKFLFVTSSPEWTSQRALQVEYSWKHPTRTRKVPSTYRGVQGRIAALQEIWKRVPDAITMQVCSEYIDVVRNIPLSDHVTITELLTY